MIHFMNLRIQMSIQLSRFNGFPAITSGLHRIVPYVAALALIFSQLSCKKGTESSGGGTGGGSNGDTLITVTALPPASVSKTNSQKIFVHYMPWFETPSTSGNGNWGIHWTMQNQNPNTILSNGQRQIASFFYPMIGPYASSDRDVIDYHTLLMKYAGIDGVIVDWSGTHAVYDYPLIRRNTDSLFNSMPRNGLQLAVCYEDATLRNVKNIAGIDTVQAAQDDFSYLKSSYFNSPGYIKIGGRPLVLCFGPQVIQVPDEWQRTFSVLDQKPVFLSLWYQGDVTGDQGSGEFPWVYSDYLSGLQNYYSNRVPLLNTAFACAYPGFKDFYAQGGWGNNLFVIDHNGSATLQNTLGLAQQSQLPYIQLITWNDFGEGTMIEPTTQFNYSFLQAIQQYTGVPYALTELELIFKWFTLKKKYASNQGYQSQLRQAYYYLVALDVSHAANLINAIN